MDATHKFVCQDDLANPLAAMAVQVSCILVISHFFHILLKALGQPGPIAQILAGLVLGPSGLCNIKKVKHYFLPPSAAQYYEMFGFFCRILFMFLFGLEVDIAFIRRNLRVVCILACGGASVGAIFGLVSSFFLREYFLEKSLGKANYVIAMMLFVAYSATPVVNRLAAELRFATSDIGRLAVSSALVIELTCLLIFNFMILCTSGKMVGNAFLVLVGLVLVLVAFRYMATWLNKRINNHKYLRNPEVFIILSILIATSMLIELANFNSIIACFLAGMAFPKEGKTARTLLHKLTYSVHNFVLPIYFGYIGFQFDGTYFSNMSNILIVLVLVLLCICSKIGGVLAVCHYLKIPFSEGVFLAFVLNLKGHADLLFIGTAAKKLFEWTPMAYNLLVMTVVISTVISGPMVAILMKKEYQLFAHTHTTLSTELEKPENELRVLGCVYGPRQVNAILSVIATLRGPQTSPIMPYLAHLIELQKKRRTNVSYHELEDDEMSDEEEYGGNDVVEIHRAVDAFTVETSILINIIKTVSTLAGLYEDVCTAAEDLRTTIILLPFHKHQRIDGKMEIGKQAVRTTNQKILRHAPSTVGIIVEKGLAGSLGFSQLTRVDTVQHVATLFFGGPDDREAIAWSTRIANHTKINLTVIRFLPTESSNTRNMKVDSEKGNNDIEVFMALSSLEMGNDIDNSFLNDFYNGFVASGKVGYVEKYVNNGTETVAALRDIGDLYTLFIVGRGGRGHSPLTTQMSDWEECPELGTVGDLLASSDFNVSGSILVVQQHRHTKKDLIDD
ncbi:cation/H(+) antiporter 2-like [Rosa rugosa]|uniref:cation/H(+) antiporter 2-like n=1 Tax=Rosa rugosa TaxID=74645 RepID=UPI002B405159|nr:cation/H(+) antiporter 2-like [Rosa rugosa]